ncbi:hypothetical protein TeGR_g12250, partial [Tetraparma gracilis]
MATISNSLVQYCDLLPSTHNQHLLFSAQSSAHPPTTSPRTSKASPRAAALHALPQNAAELEDVLNAILPPHRELPSGAFPQGAVRAVSAKAGGRESAGELKRDLGAALEDMQVRNKPACEGREQLFAESFDEIIRQVTLDSPERGLMLLRVRDEI